MKKLLCKIFFHKLILTHSTRDIEHTLCMRCKGRFYIYHPMRSFLPADKELDDCFVDLLNIEKIKEFK